MSRSVYLVGDTESEKTNDWLAVCQTLEEAERLLALIEEAIVIKEVS